MPVEDRCSSRLRSVTLHGVVATLFGLLCAAAPLLSVPASASAADPAPPKASILVDADTGQVLAADNARQPLRVASTAKLFTALVASSRVPFDEQVAISPRAAGEPALNINAKAGQVWLARDLYECLFIVSANDAAMALAEAAGPGIDNFHSQLADLTKQLGLADNPVLQDPAGLDDDFSVNGGNLVSARDLAIAARAVLADQQLAPLATQREYRFKGGDGLDHRIVTHDRFLEQYPGAVGLKTGYTKQAGPSLVAAATRNGRTLVAVVLDAPDPVAVASSLLDLGWGTPPTGHADTLPPVPGTPAAVAAARAAAPKGVEPARTLQSERTVRRAHPSLMVLVAVGAAGLAAIALLTAASVRQERAAAARRRRARARARARTRARG